MLRSFPRLMWENMFSLLRSGFSMTFQMLCCKVKTKYRSFEYSPSVGNDKQKQETRTVGNWKLKTVLLQLSLLHWL